MSTGKLKSMLRRAIIWITRGVPVVKAHIEVSAPSSLLRGKAVLVTGGGRGLGRVIAERCVREGAKVVITGRNESKLRQTSYELGDACSYVVSDVSDIKSLPSLFERAELLVGMSIDTLVSNAGISLHEGRFDNVSEHDWDVQMDTNLKGGYFLCTSFVSYLEKHKAEAGNILVISSERARRPDDIPYGLTKVATDSYVRAMAIRLIQQGIRINALSPGVTCSDMTARDSSGDIANWWQNNGRLFLPEEVAEVAVFLLSDLSNCISGEIIACNQGNAIAVWD